MVPSIREESMTEKWTTGNLSSRLAGVFVLGFALGAFGAGTAVAQATGDRPMLTAKVSRWLGDPVKKKKGPKGFDIQFRLVGARFDGTFGVEGLPQSVPEGEAFEAQIKLYNIGSKGIKVSTVTVVGDGVILATELTTNKVDPKSVETLASFKIPPQSSAGSSFLITVVLSNGDKHSATLTFSKPA